MRLVKANTTCSKSAVMRNVLKVFKSDGTKIVLIHVQQRQRQLKTITKFVPSIERWKPSNVCGFCWLTEISLVIGYVEYCQFIYYHHSQHLAHCIHLIKKKGMLHKEKKCFISQSLTNKPLIGSLLMNGKEIVIPLSSMT